MAALEINIEHRELGLTQALLPNRVMGSAAERVQLVHQQFEEMATLHPQAIAATFDGVSKTYGELSEQSSKLAHWLLANGVCPNVAVGVCVKPSFYILVAILAIWKAGGVYFPLDPEYPALLIQSILEEVNPAVVLTTSNLFSLVSGHPVLCFDSDWDRVREHPGTSPPVASQIENPAYLIYTSGTTGKPKGVIATHGNLIHYLSSAVAKYGFTRGDVFTSLARYTFSISLFELMSPLCCGGQVRLLDRNDVLTPARLAATLNDITVLHAGPSLLSSLFRFLRLTNADTLTFPRMRHASSGGDTVSPLIMRDMTHFFPNADLFVIYGCTEIGCMGTTFQIPRGTSIVKTYIGTPFPDVTLRLLDTNRALVPPSEVGEIAIAGNGVARGYLGQPQLTTEKFVELGSQRFYLTGDMGRLHPDGNVEILGRRDFQVQVRGIRVETVGIETTILDLNLASQCAVLAVPGDDGEARLVAFVVHPNVSDSSTLRHLLAEQLPDYMIPHYVVSLDSLPLTANGKVDRSALAGLQWNEYLMPSGPSSRHLPTSELESAIAGVFSEVLKRSDFGVNDNFFDLGGDSLLGVFTLDTIARRTGIVIPPQRLFEHGTVTGLARHSQDGMTAESHPVLLNGDGRHPALFMLSGHHIYRQLANRVAGRWSAYGVFAPFEVATLDSTSPDERSVEELAKEYWTIIRRQQKRGPYCLLGYSFAGLIAFELAHQIQRSGEAVGYLVLVDAVLPEWALGWRYRLRQLNRLTQASPRHVWDFALRRLGAQFFRTSKDDFFRYKNDERLGPLEYRRELLNGAAASRYLAELRPYPGRARVIVSGERLRADPLKSPNCGWSPYIRDLSIARVETDHFRMMSDEPYVGHIADVLCADLDTDFRAT